MGCHKVFVSNRSSRKYCSQSCYRKAPRKPHSDGTKLKIRNSNLGLKRSPETCKRNGESHVGLPVWSKGVKFTKEHRDNISKSKVGITLSQSHREHISIGLINGAPHVFSTASLEKMRIENTGDKNPNWKGGKTPLLIKIRQSPRMAEWRNAVFRRDNYRDFYSGCGGNIVAHHIIPFKKLVKEYNITTFEQSQTCEGLWDVDNGMTMLKSSHVFYHSLWGK